MQYAIVINAVALKVVIHEWRRPFKFDQLKLNIILRLLYE